MHGEHGWDSADPDGSNWKHRATRRAFRPTVQRWIALSSHIENYLRSSVGVPARRLTRICNGVDIERFQPLAGGRTAISGSPFDDHSFCLVGTVGRLQTVKDQTNLVRALAYAIGKSAGGRARLRLAIVGDGPQRAEVEAVIAATGMEPYVWLAGARDDIPSVVRGLDIFALPSLAEGISNTILEAMACGLPVVATRVGGNPDLVHDGQTGLLVPPADPRALGEALLALLHEPAARRRLGQTARTVCERSFSLERMVADYAAVYDQLLAERGVAVPALAGSRH
ncbi:MAG: glycosyltransferase [Burkholderiaceae bacterium]|nr:glycosyltransferase [Burkholderiaceae bacterium]